GVPAWVGLWRWGATSNAPVAPASSAARVSRMASAVELEPVPAMTGVRPRAKPITAFTTSMCSSWGSVADSPVEPQGTRPLVPPAICSSTSFSRAPRSGAPLRNGVRSAVRQPAHMSHLDGAFEDLDRVAGHPDVVVGSPFDVERTARQRDAYPPAGASGACCRHRRRAGAGPARQRLARAALPDAHLERVRTGDPHAPGVHAAGVAGV